MDRGTYVSLALTVMFYGVLVGSMYKTICGIFL